MDDERRWQLPLLLTAALILVAGSRLEATRPLEAGVLAFGFPLLAIGLALAPLRDSASELRNAGLTLGGLGVLASEVAVARAFGVLPPALSALARSPVLPWLLVGLAAAAVAVQAIAAQRGMRTFVGAWFGMVAALAIYLPGHFAPEKERFGQVLAALLVSLIVGGGPGLLAGAAASKLVKRA